MRTDIAQPKEEGNSQIPRSESQEPQALHLLMGPEVWNLTSLFPKGVYVNGYAPLRII